MSPASYLTAPPRVAACSIARRARTRLTRGQPSSGQRQPVGRADRCERALGADLPAEYPAGVGMQRIEVLPVRAQRLVTDTRLALHRRRRDGLAELDAAVVANGVGRDRAVTEV